MNRIEKKWKQRYKVTLIALLAGLLVSCGSGDGEGLFGGGECSIAEQNKTVHEILLDKYFWYQDVVQTLDYETFDSPEQTLDFLKVEQDRFSYITDADEFNALFTQGQTVKYGFSFQILEDNTAQVMYSFDDSSAGRAGLERGDRILSVNNQTIEQVILNESWEDEFGPDEVGVSVDIQVRKLSGETVNMKLEKSVVNVNTVLHHSVIDNGSDKVGYLIFQSFLSTSIEELNQVFADFKAAAVNKVILDLRYNGGGSVAVSKHLASLMRISNNNSDLFAELRYNNKYQNLNSRYYYESQTNSLNLDRVTIIATGGTASASELVINGLKPFVDIKTVGSTTYGKPVGMNAYEFCDKVILPITFSSYNQDGEGEFYNGIPADCSSEDDLNFAFGDIQDPMLKEALHVSLNNSCSSSLKAQKTTLKEYPKSGYSLQDIIGVY